jgi:hypothetical protein
MKKTVIIVAAIFIIALSGCIYVSMGTRNAEKLMWGYLATKGYNEDDIEDIEIKHSFINILLSYNEWAIKVQYADEPKAKYGFTIKGGQIVETGVYGDVDKEDLKHKH